MVSDGCGVPGWWEYGSYDSEVDGAVGLDADAARTVSGFCLLVGGVGVPGVGVPGWELLGVGGPDVLPNSAVGVEGFAAKQQSWLTFGDKKISMWANETERVFQN